MLNNFRVKDLNLVLNLKALFYKITFHTYNIHFIVLNGHSFSKTMIIDYIQDICRICVNIYNFYFCC